MTWKCCMCKKVFFNGIFPCLLLLCILANVSADISITERNGLLRTFQNLAILDGNAAIDVWAAPDVAEKWKKEASEVLGNPLISAAFLAPAMMLAGPEDSKISVGGYFNPWINALLILKIDKTAKGLRITDTDLKMLSKSMALQGKGPDELAKILLSRFKKARSQIKTAAGSWKGSKQNNSGQNEWQELKKRLEPEIKVARGTLAPDGDPAKASLRQAFGRIMDELRGGSNDDTGLNLTGTEPQDWQKTLSPVHVDEFETCPVVILASRGYPLSLLWIQMDETSSQPVKKRKILHIPRGN